MFSELDGASFFVDVLSRAPLSIRPYVIWYVLSTRTGHLLFLRST